MRYITDVCWVSNVLICIQCRLISKWRRVHHRKCVSQNVSRISEMPSRLSHSWSRKHKLFVRVSLAIWDSLWFVMHYSLIGLIASTETVSIVETTKAYMYSFAGEYLKVINTKDGFHLGKELKRRISVNIVHQFVVLSLRCLLHCMESKSRSSPSMWLT